MPANSTLSLLIETKTSGSNEISRLEQALNRLSDASEKAGERADNAAKKHANAAKEISDRLKGFGESPLTSGIAELEKFGTSLGKIGGIAVGAIAGIGAIGAAAFELAKNYGAAAEAQVNFATRLGISIGQGQRLSAMARLAGVDVGILESSTRLVAQALEDSGGKGARAAKALEQLGVSTRTISGDTRDLGAVTTDVIEKLAGVESITKRTALANAILGRGSKELQPLLADYKELQNTVKNLGIGLDESGTKQLAALNREIKTADIAWEQFKKKLAVNIAPILIPVIQFVVGANNGKPLTLEEARKQGFKIPRQFAPRSRQEQLEDAESAGFYDPLDTAAQARASVLDTIGKFAATQFDLQKGKALSSTFEARFAQSDEDFIRNRIQQIRSGRTGPGGIEIKGTDELRQILLSNDVGASAKQDAAQQLAQGEAEIKQLELRLKLIDSAKQGELEILKVRQEVAGALANPYGVLPSERKFLEFKSRPGVTPEQVHQYAVELYPQFIKEQADAFKKGIAAGRAATDSAAEAAGLTPIPKTPEELSKQLRETEERRAAQLKLQVEQELKRQEEAAPILANIHSLKATTQLSGIESGITIQGILGGPGTELNTAARLASAKKDSLQEEYEYQLKLDEAQYAYSDVLEEKKKETRLKYAQEVANVEINLAEQVAEEQKRQRDQARDFAGSFFDSAVSRQLPQFFRGYGLNIGKTIFQNATTDIFSQAKYQLPGQGTVGNPTFLGKLFQGTPLGLDPIKGSTDLNTAATKLNTDALDRVTREIEATKASGTEVPGASSPFSGVSLSNGFSFLSNGPGSSSTGDLSNGFSFLSGGASIPSAVGLGLDYLGYGTAGASAIANIAKVAESGGGIKAIGSELGSVGGLLSKIPALSQNGIQTGPGTATTYSSLIGTGLQVGGGVLGLINGLNTGGARGGLQAAGGAAAAVGGILPLISSSLAVAGPIGAAAGALLGIVSSFFGDPKQIRQKQISKTAEDYQFYQPESINLSEGTNGGYSDYDRFGNVRSSNISPYPSVSEPYYLFRQHVLVPGTTNSQFGGPSGNQTVGTTIVNINALDSQSFADYAASNHQAIADAFLLNMDRGNTSVVDRLRTNIGT